ncbi:related to mRNA 3'-end-processing protein RNA15 [Saccharomycodes ludwigii]|uniref:Related to mRNA 3'-end-processing protein RNA15 n=1 Tax=Saccharomycodes ludwigii TaxID=36035 RepID=A0A376B260_9ASCO|nr:hypothetical protein SCDLUD_001443 [Saccharomycodes ludwigii]KAH3901673.1 hypothetical protein SCDLUD_001443 [Saccharomycodes ludwigii]SSD58564.1 related to mRNA 3'-end-processing protein RNA15 [Saccharomycodes ludwigii]
MDNKPSNIVYLGNIPFDQTEEQILDLCSNVGPVRGLKMMFDPNTGKSRGFCFIEFNDINTSSSAVRNLNGYQLGSRTLKCGFSDEGSTSVTATAVNNGRSNTNSGINNSANNNTGPNQKLPIFSYQGKVVNCDNIGIDINTTMTTPAMMLSSILANNYGKEKQLKVLDLLKQESSEAENSITLKLLLTFPQLNFALAEILLSNGLSTVEDLSKLAITNNDSISDKNGSEEGKQNQENPRKYKKTQLGLLKQVLQLNDTDISMLPPDEKIIIYDLKQRAMKGDFGPI